VLLEVEGVGWGWVGVGVLFGGSVGLVGCDVRMGVLGGRAERVIPGSS
jgi:hypothetical protein